MIAKMKFISLVGPRDNFDRIVAEHLMNFDIEFENPLHALKSTDGFTLDNSPNPYESTMKRFTDVLQYVNIPYQNVRRHQENLSQPELEEFLEHFDSRIHTLKEKIEGLELELRHYDEVIQTMTPVIDANVHLESLSKLHYLHYRFGKLPISSYEKLGDYLKNMPAYFYALTSNREYVWGIYFVSDIHMENIDRIFSTLYFEPLTLEGTENGTPAHIIREMTRQGEQKRVELASLREQLQTTITAQKGDLLRGYTALKYHYDLYQIHHYALVSQNAFCLTGWTDEKTALELQKHMESDTTCSLMVDDPDSVQHIMPPTKLNNKRIFKPFEDFVRMYGVPNYNELDPTPFLGLIYTLLFGIMFGDLGHGLCLFLIGFLLSVRKKGGFLGKLLIPIGLSSAVFGVLYGSFFGFEGEHAMIHPIWYTPFENSETMMRTLIYAIVLGIAIILVCMIFNIINGIRQKSWQKVLFSQNGFAGMAFYTLALYCGITALLDSKHPLLFAGVLIGLSLLLIFLQEPLGKLLAKQKDWMPKEKGGFLLESFFELFEIVLSFITNTVSFLRVGAFALNHAGMMSVVVMFMLQLNTAGSIAIAIFGNLLVIGLEGLIVGIQVLRLGFYEMFSRFYDGGGREFTPTNRSA